MKSVSSPEDLITSKESTIAGFEWQAEQKLIKAGEFDDRADRFLLSADEIKDIATIRNDPELFEFCIAACLISKKSLTHLPAKTQDDILAKLINLDRLGDSKYLRELERRYYLSSGDSLGGSMRNVVGQDAQNTLSTRIVERLYGNGQTPQVERNSSKTKIKSITWGQRSVVFDRKPEFIGNSVDIIVVRNQSALTGQIEDPLDYSCCGELKGGIDPAGADEHWKTARSALGRIRGVFDEQGFEIPNLVFIGRAIEPAMASEIYGLLESNWLAGAANVNYQDQVDEVIDIILE